MTKRDFELIAGVLSDATAMGDDVQGLAEAFVIALAQTNPRFDPVRFLKAALNLDEPDDSWTRVAR